MRSPMATLLFSVMVCTASSAPAQTATQRFADSPALKKCMDAGEAAHGVTAAIRECLFQEIHRQDVKLNATYRTAMARLNATQRRQLRLSERRWLAGLRGYCEKSAYADVDGTMALILYDGCILASKQTRGAWLVRHYGTLAD